MRLLRDKSFILGLVLTGLFPVESLLATGSSSSWTGGDSSNKRDWQDASNWDNGVPNASTTDASFPTTSVNYGGEVYLNGNVVVGSIAVNANSLAFAQIVSSNTANTTYTLNMYGDAGLLFDMPNFPDLFTLGSIADTPNQNTINTVLDSDGAFRIGSTSNFQPKCK